MSNCERLVITDAWVREAPEGVPVMAAYMKLSNPGKTSVTIITAESDAFERIEFHQSFEENDISKMQQLPVLQVPPSAQLLLEQGGRHMMLFNPVGHLKDGDRLTIDLACATQDTVSVPLQVKRVIGNTSPHEHHQH